MVRALLGVVRSLRSAWLFELAGAGLVIGGVYEIHGAKGALIGAGVAALAKSVELEQRGQQ